MRALALGLGLLLAGCARERPYELSSPAEYTADGTLPGLGWLSGSWASTGGDMEEHWTFARGGTMLGVGRFMIGKRTMGYEHLRIVEDKGGEVVYHAHPSGQAPTAFKLVERSPGKLVFANPEHDYPQRIIYTRLAEGQLVARIEGVKDGKPKSSQWELWRVPRTDGWCTAR